MRLLTAILTTAIWLGLWPFMLAKVLAHAFSAVSLHVACAILDAWSER